MEHRFYVILEERHAKELIENATREYRSPRDQVHKYIIEGLRRDKAAQAESSPEAAE